MIDLDPVLLVGRALIGAAGLPLLSAGGALLGARRMFDRARVSRLPEAAPRDARPTIAELEARHGAPAPADAREVA